MKNAISKSTLLALGLMLLILPGLGSCKKDKNADEPSLREQLVGEWEIQSLSVDGLEMMGLILNSSNLEFEAIKGSKGDYKWSFAYTDGTGTIATGDYEVDEDSKELTFDSDTADEASYDIDLDGDKLELSGIVDGARYELKLERD